MSIQDPFGRPPGPMGGAPPMRGPPPGQGPPSHGPPPGTCSHFHIIHFVDTDIFLETIPIIICLIV